MNIFVILVGIITILASFKWKSRIGFSIVGLIGLYGWSYAKYQPSMDPLEVIDLLVRYDTRYVLLTAAVGFFLGSGILSVIAKFADQRKEKEQLGALRGMRFMVGSILQTNTETTVFTDVNLTRNAFGGPEINTSHEVQVSHNTWICDVRTNREVNYTGSGRLKARVGHILGTMSYCGRSLVDINFTTGSRFTVNAASTSPIYSALWAILMIVFGWAIFPIIALLSPLVWVGAMKWKGDDAVYLNYVAPGTHFLEAVYTYVGGLIYLFALYYVFSYQGGHIHDIGAVTTLVFFILVGLHQYTVRSAKSIHDTLIETGSAELNRIYLEAANRG